MPRNIDESKQFLAEEWESILQETVNSLIKLMENKYKLVLAIEFHIKIFMYPINFQANSIILCTY